MVEITQFSVNSHDYSIEHINSYHITKKKKRLAGVQFKLRPKHAGTFPNNLEKVFFKARTFEAS